VEGLDAAIVFGGPTAVLVAADSAFEPIHEKNRQFTVYSQPWEKKNVKRANSMEKELHRVHGEQRGPQERKKALGMGHAGDGVC
jgi:hypothetical protein